MRKPLVFVLIFIMALSVVSCIKSPDKPNPTASDDSSPIDEPPENITMEGMLEQVAFYHNGGSNGKPTNRRKYSRWLVLAY